MRFFLIIIYFYNDYKVRGSAADSAAIGHEAACTLLDDGGRRILTDLGIIPTY